jgi:hypothetical protein
MQSDTSIDSSTTMARVQEGMRVVDVAGDEVGKVEYVKMGDPEAVTTEGNDPAPTGLIGRIADAVLPGGPEPDVPAPLRDNLLRTGFLKIDGRGLFDSDRYVSSERVRDVSGDVVHLDVRKDRLARKDQH